MTELLIFAASFGQVFGLGFNSKLLRDDHILAAFFGSWFITLATYCQIIVIAGASLPVTSMLFFGGLGGSLGITAAQYLYKYLQRRSDAKTNRST